MRPDAEADEAGREHREDDEAIADEFGLRDRRDDHAHHARGGKEDDVDLGMTEEPEEMLPKQRIAAPRRVEKGPVEGALHFEQQRARDVAGKCYADHHRDYEQSPRETRNP